MNRWFIAVMQALAAFVLISAGVAELLLGKSIGKSITTNLVLPLAQIAAGVWLAIVSARTAHARSGKISFPETRKSR